MGHQSSIGAIIGLVVLSLMVYQCSQILGSDQAKPAKSATSPKEEIEFQATLALANLLKQNSKNPAKFEIVRVDLMSDNTACFQYRGTNSFNAVVFEQKSYGLDGTERPWNAHCANKTGRDMTFVRAAMN